MQILTVSEAAEFLKISEDVLYPMLNRGEIPAAKIKGQWRLIQSDLVEHIRSQYNLAPRQKEKEPCHTEEKGLNSGGSSSTEYARVLKLKTTKTPKR